MFVAVEALDGEVGSSELWSRLGLPRDEGFGAVVAAVSVDRGVVQRCLGEVAGVAGHLASPLVVLLPDGDLVLQLPARGCARHGVDGCVRGDVLVGSLGRGLGLRRCLLGFLLVRSLLGTV